LDFFALIVQQRSHRREPGQRSVPRLSENT
jgi:hypothetical protein